MAAAAPPPAGPPPAAGVPAAAPAAPDLHLHIPPEATPRRRRRPDAADSAYEGSGDPSPSSGRYGIVAWHADVGGSADGGGGWDWPLLRAWRRPEGLLVIWMLAALLVGVTSTIAIGGAAGCCGGGL